MKRKIILVYIIPLLLIVLFSNIFVGCSKKDETHSIKIIDVTKDDYYIVFGEESETLDHYKIDFEAELPECVCQDGKVVVNYYIERNPDNENLIYTTTNGGLSDITYSYNYKRCYFSINFFNPKQSSTHYDGCFKLKDGDIFVIEIKCAEDKPNINIVERVKFSTLNSHNSNSQDNLSIYHVGNSMMPTIGHQTIYYHYASSYNKNDIVLFRNNNEKYFSGNTDTIICKRIIATSNDNVKFEFYKYEKRQVGDLTYISAYYNLYLNNELLQETYTMETENYLQISVETNTGSLTSDEKYNFIKLVYETLKTTPSEGYLQIGNVSVNIAENHSFVMGDNRNHSTDSGYYGEITNNDIIGVVEIS